MSDKEKILASIQEKGLLDQESFKSLQERLRKKLRQEEAEQAREFVTIRKKLTELQTEVLP